MINLAYKGKNQGSSILWHTYQTYQSQTPVSTSWTGSKDAPDVPAPSGCCQPWGSVLWGNTNTGQQQSRQDWSLTEICWPMPGPGGMQALGWFWSCLTFPASSPCPYPQPWVTSPQLHSPISFPWQSTPRLLSQWPFVGSHHFSCLLSLNIPAWILHYQHPLHPILGLFPTFFNLLSSFLAGCLDTPHHLFAYWPSVQLSPLARPIPAPVSNVNVLP